MFRTAGREAEAGDEARRSREEMRRDEQRKGGAGAAGTATQKAEA